MFRIPSKISKEFELWGEIPVERQPVMTDDTCLSLILSSFKPEDPKVKLPVIEEEGQGNNTVALPNHWTHPNEIIRHTIRLEHHSKSVQRLIRLANLSKSDHFRECPPVPEIYRMRGKENKFKKYEPPSQQKHCEFAVGQGRTFPLLDSNAIDKILRKTVMTISAHAGFDNVRGSVSVYLISFIKYILKKLADTLHTSNQKDILNGRITYKDTLEKTLQYFGLSGMKSIKEYWQADILARRDRAYKKSAALYTLYNKLINKFITPFINK